MTLDDGPVAGELKAMSIIVELNRLLPIASGGMFFGNVATTSPATSSVIGRIGPADGGDHRDAVTDK